MALIKCKMCGGDIRLDEGKTFGTCEYCGSVMTLPRISDEQRAAAFNRGNHFRRMGEFDKALAVYERIVAEDDADAEAHWCCALCRFGIEYVEDPATYEWLPTCHRASFDSFLEDVDYLAAVEHSDGITRRQYQKDAAKIAEVQRGILATSQSAEPYDVFISYKELDADGNRTRDSILAQEIYYRLTEKGWRVFFSRISLEDVPGTQYEPYIFAALNSAKVMIVVGTSAENLNAVWVKNEWSRYLSLMRKDRTKLLIPCYRDMDPYDLPEQLSVLMSYDMGKIGFIQDLIRGVDKVLNAEKPKEAAPAAAPVKERVIVQQSGGGPNVTALLKRGHQALEDGDWDKACGFYDQVLSMDAENAEAFLGLALAGTRSRDTDAYVRYLTSQEPTVETMKLPRDEAAICAAVERMDKAGYHNTAEYKHLYDFDGEYDSCVRSQKALAEKTRGAFNADKNLKRAFRYAQGETMQKLDKLKTALDAALDRRIKASQDAEDAAIARAKEEYERRIKRADDKAKKIFSEKEQQYRAAVALQERAADEAAFADAQRAFRVLGNYKDTEARANVCVRKEAELKAAREKEERLKKEREEQERQIAAEKAAKKRKRTIAIVTPIVLACIAFLIVLTTIIIPKQKLNKAIALLDSGDYEAAYALLEELGDNETIAASKYDRAVALLDSGDYESTYKLLDGLNYNDSASLLDIAKHEYSKSLLSRATVGSYVPFGSYEQDNDLSNGKEDIEWMVLAKEGDRILVISRYALDHQQYNTEAINGVTWETCTLRTWLNDTFLNTAFSKEEQAMIPTVTVSADKNPDYSTSPGNSTKDQVFLLSIEEVNKYFNSNRGIIGYETAFCTAQKTGKSFSYINCWWLRTPGYFSTYAAFVYKDFVNSLGCNVAYFGVVNASTTYFVSVRPAMWIEIEE